MGITVTQSMGTEDWNRSPQLLNRLDVVGAAGIKHFAKNFLSADPVPDFFTLEIETVNRCNNDCPFCPVNRHNDTRKPAKLDEKLFESIIAQLKHMDFRGHLSLFSNNEPLLDGRIFRFIEYARKNLPNAHHCLYTNGILLDRKKFLSLAENLDLLIIDNYDDDFQLLPNIREILDSNLPQNFRCEVNISMRKKNQKLNTRAGYAPNRLDEEKYRAHSACILPFTKMIIRPNGTVAKCCSDPLGDMTLGDTNSQGLREIWRGKNFQDFRKAMYYGERASIKGCDLCDVFGFFNYIPPFAKPDEHERLAKEISLRKNLGAVYIFDTNQISRAIISRLELYGVRIDGVITVNGEEEKIPYLKHLTLEQAMEERAFILLPTPYYDDRLFDFFHAKGYRYEKDFLIYSPDVW